MKEAFLKYSTGDFEGVLSEIKSSKKRFKLTNNKKGLLEYWSALSHLKLFNFDESIMAFKNAIKLGHQSDDLFYEYGQALYAQEKYKTARSAFKTSLKKGYKKAVSLYYIGYCSQLLGDKRTAVKMFKSIEKIDDLEKSEVIQPARMQIAEIFLEQAKRTSKSSRTIEKLILPQYQRALDYNPKSQLAPIIRDKIEKIQQQYELVLFQLRNGRPTQRPPYLIRGSLGTSYDSNVNSITENSYESSKDASALMNFSFIGRYTFYIKDLISSAPGLNINYSKFLNDETYINNNDSLSLNFILRNAYEHTIKGKDASFLFDFEYNQLKTEKTLEDSTNSMTFILGERLGLGIAKEIVLRYFFKKTESDFSNSFNTTSHKLQLENSTTWKRLFLISLLSFTKETGDELAALDKNTFQVRNDIILPKLLWSTPTIGLDIQKISYGSLTSRDNDLLISPTINLSKSLKKGMRLIWDCTYTKYFSDVSTSEYSKWSTGLNFEYIYF